MIIGKKDTKLNLIMINFQWFFRGEKMTQIIYLKGDATNPIAKGNKIIAHICNDAGGWGKGFVLAISRK